MSQFFHSGNTASRSSLLLPNPGTLGTRATPEPLIEATADVVLELWTLCEEPWDKKGK